MLVALVKVQWQLRYPYPPNPDGWYYWTNAFFKDVPDPMDFVSYVPDMETPVLKFLSREGQVNWIRVQSPPEAEPPLESAYAFNHWGEADYTGPIILENVARVHLFVGQELVGYRLLRAAIPTEFITDGVIRADLVDRMQTEFADALIANEQTTREGVRLTSAVVLPTIRHWQLRTGTKRRRRVVIA